LNPRPQTVPVSLYMLSWCIIFTPRDFRQQNYRELAC